MHPCTELVQAQNLHEGRGQARDLLRVRTHARWLFQHGGRYTLLQQSGPLGVDMVHWCGILEA